MPVRPTTPHNDEPSPRQAVFFPGLNGLRALAALGVLVSHTQKSLARFGLPEHVGLQFANDGVTIFFTLSGFLITYLLLQEKARYASVDIKSFYIRRILRIWPLYFVYIAAVLLAIPQARSAGPYLILYFVFLPNLAFNLDRAPEGMSHLWSIGVEEQFYAFWPLVVARVNRLTRFLLTLIVGLLIIRLGLKLYSGHIGDKLPFSISISMRFDCMAIGALFAIGYDRRDKLLIKISRSIFVPLAFWTFVGLALFNRFSLFSMVTDVFIAVLTGAFILNQIERGTRTTALENPAASFLGRISYGIYVYHPLVIALLARVLAATKRMPANEAVALAMIAVPTIALAWLSHTFLERPFLALKSRFARVRSSDH